MAKKHYYLTIDTETTQDNLVADFAAVISDRRGRIHSQCAVLVNGIFTDMVNHPLFFDSNATTGIWSRNGRDKRYDIYNAMVQNGTRGVHSIAAINRWLERALGQYDPILTAYNLPFDLDKCHKTGIDLTIFDQSFCLWAAAQSHWGKTKKYRQFILDCHAFNAPTSLGNMTYKTNAEIMTRFILGNPELPDEPHTALEDIIYYELVILNRLVKNYSFREIQEFAESYDWRKYQVKDWFKVK